MTLKLGPESGQTHLNCLDKWVEKLFDKAIVNQFQGLTMSEYRQSQTVHGREETRYYQMLSNITHEIDPDGEWKHVNSIGYVDYLRTEKEQPLLQRRYFIS